MVLSNSTVILQNNNDNDNDISDNDNNNDNYHNNYETIHLSYDCHLNVLISSHQSLSIQIYAFLPSYHFIYTIYTQRTLHLLAPTHTRSTETFHRALSNLTGQFEWARSDLTGQFDWHV